MYNRLLFLLIIKVPSLYCRALLDDMTAIIRSSNGSSTWRYLVTYKETNSREILTPPLTTRDLHFYFSLESLY